MKQDNNEHRDSNLNNKGTANKKKGLLSISSLWRDLSPRERKLFFRLGVCLIIGIVLMNLWSVGSDSDDRDKPDEEPQATVDIATTDDGLAQELSELLMEVKGAGRVQVLVRYANSGEHVYSYDTETQWSETDPPAISAESRTLSAANDSPVLLKDEAPLVEGVIVIAEGAGDALVQERLYQAVSSLLGLPANRIAIIEMEQTT